MYYDCSAMLHSRQALTSPSQPHKLSEHKVFDTDCENAVPQEASPMLAQQQQSVAAGMCTIQNLTCIQLHLHEQRKLIQS